MECHIASVNRRTAENLDFCVKTKTYIEFFKIIHGKTLYRTHKGTNIKKNILLTHLRSPVQTHRNEAHLLPCDSTVWILKVTIWKMCRMLRVKSSWEINTVVRSQKGRKGETIPDRLSSLITGVVSTIIKNTWSSALTMLPEGAVTSTKM